MKNRIINNLGIKFMSLLLAILLWFMVAQSDDPQETTPYFTIPVKLTNTELLDQQNKVYEVLDNTDTVKVTIRAPRSVVRDLRASDIVAIADMSKLTDINTIAITYTVQNTNPENIQSIRGDHDVVKLNVEERASKLVQVVCKTEGEVPEGYIIADANTDYNLLQISGPKSVVDKISYAGVTINMAGATSQMSLNAEPKFYNAQNKEVESKTITRNVDWLHITVSVLETKEIPVEYEVLGEPAEGYMATGIVTCNQESVVIAGTHSALGNLDSIWIPSENLDITGRTDTLISTYNVRTMLKNYNLRLADSNFDGNITVTAFIEKKAEKICKIQPEAIVVTGLPAGYTLEYSQEDTTYDLRISGLNAVVSKLQRDGVEAYLNVGDWMEKEKITELKSGVYQIPVTVNLQPNVEKLNEVNATVTITLAEDAQSI